MASTRKMIAALYEKQREKASDLTVMKMPDSDKEMAELKTVLLEEKWKLNRLTNVT